MALKSNPYNTGGVVAPRGLPAWEEGAGTALQMATACEGTVENQPNVNNVNPGSHHETGKGIPQASNP